MLFYLIKEIKKTYSSCILELHKQLGIFKNTREVLEKHSPAARASRTSRETIVGRKEEGAFYLSMLRIYPHLQG